MRSKQREIRPPLVCSVLQSEPPSEVDGWERYPELESAIGEVLVPHQLNVGEPQVPEAVEPKITGNNMTSE